MDKNASMGIQSNTSYNYNDGKGGYTCVLNTPKPKATTAENKALGKEEHQAREI